MSAKDIVVVSVVLFTLAIGFLVMNYMSHTVSDKLNSNAQWNSSAGAVASANSMKTVSNRLDYVMFGFFIGTVLAMMITSWLLASYPIFMFFYFLVTIIAIGVSAILSNTFETVSTMPIFGTTINNLPITAHILENLPYYVAGIGLVGMLIIFSKNYLTESG